MIDAYLRDKIVDHVAGILQEYIENPDDVCAAAWDILEAVENEMIWAETPK